MTRTGDKYSKSDSDSDSDSGSDSVELRSYE